MYYVIFLFQNKKDDRGVYPQGFHGLRNRDILFKPIPLNKKFFSNFSDFKAKKFIKL